MREPPERGESIAQRSQRVRNILLFDHRVRSEARPCSLVSARGASFEFAKTEWLRRPS